MHPFAPIFVLALAAAGFFTLYTATYLTPPVNWIPDANPAVLTNNQWRVTLPVATNGSWSYRL